MNWEEIATGPAVTLASGIGGALLAQVGIWLHVHKEARDRQAVENAGLAMARLGNEETANERLFRTFNERLTASEQRSQDCERAKRELEERLNHMSGTLIRLSAAVDIMRAAYAAAGLKEPRLPTLDDREPDAGPGGDT